MIPGYYLGTSRAASDLATAKGSARILFLNHHPAPAGALVEFLRATGHQVEETGSIREADRVLHRHRPDLVVLNPVAVPLASPEMELLEDLQRHDSPVPVILLVEDLESFYAANSSRIPICDFISKPHSPDELVHRVQQALVHRAQHLALQERARELEGQVSVDFKTNLISERHFKDILTMEFKRSQRHANPMALLLVDVDDFKGINDSTDYSFGDEVLMQVAKVLKNTVRATDYAARFGGDEFVLLLPCTTPAEAVRTAVRVRKKISDLRVTSRSYQAQVTVSIGIGTFDARARGTPDALCRHANKALQGAKQRGKNRVWLQCHPREAPGRASDMAGGQACSHQ